jgi:hypothetical protein
MGRDRSAVGLFEEGKEGRGRGSSGPVKKEVKFVLKLNFCSRVQEGVYGIRVNLIKFK